MTCSSRPRYGRQFRHRIFFALGMTIVLSVVVAGFVVHSTSNRRSETAGLKGFATDRFASVWDDSKQRQELVASIERHFKVQLTLRDAHGRVLYGVQALCAHRIPRLAVVRNGQVLGSVEACVPNYDWPKQAVIGLFSLVLVLWALSGFLARSLVRPLDELVKVVRDIGEGRLDARIALRCHHHRGEIGEVAEAVNQMAEKIEQQIAGQRELLAAVSHEIRSPLARLRVLVELEREAEGEGVRLSSMDSELSELDSLVGQLLAKSRLELQPLERKALQAGDVARTALERASLPLSLLRDEAGEACVDVDASLFVRALLNLLDNAKHHGQTLEALSVRVEGNQVRFEIVDSGPGFDESTLKHAFEPFVSQRQSEGLGLGLSLVERIVRAHGGRVWLANGAFGGAIATVELPRAASP